MNYKTANEVKTNRKNNSNRDVKPSRDNANIVSTKDYTGSNQPVIYGFKCIGGHPGLTGKWERYEG